MLQNKFLLQDRSIPSLKCYICSQSTSVSPLGSCQIGHNLWIWHPQQPLISLEPAVKKGGKSHHANKTYLYFRAGLCSLKPNRKFSYFLLGTEVESVIPGEHTEGDFFLDHHCDNPREGAATSSVAVTLKPAFSDRSTCFSWLIALPSTTQWQTFTKMKLIMRVVKQGKSSSGGNWPSCLDEVY